MKKKINSLSPYGLTKSPLLFHGDSAKVLHLFNDGNSQRNSLHQFKRVCDFGFRACAFILLTALALFSCSEDESTLVNKETVQFELNVPAVQNNGGRVAGDIPSDAKVRLELAGPNGVIQKELQILTFGDNYLLEPVELTVGSYKLTSFLVLDNTNEVIFASPKEGSPLSSAVDNALPHSFTVQKGKIRNLTVQVIATTGITPEHFGYVSFGIDVVKPLAISVFVEKNGALVLTSASGEISSVPAGNVIQSFDLAEKVNYVSFEGSSNGDYVLTVNKPGYLPSTKTFQYDSLGFTHSLTVVLKEEIPMLTLKGVAGMEVHLGLTISGGDSVKIHWGDGTSDILFGEAYAIHFYASDTAAIRLSGALDQVTSLYINQMGVVKANFETLPNLASVGVDNSSVGELDLSKNYEIKAIDSNNGTVKQVNLGDAKMKLKYLAVSNHPSDDGTLNVLLSAVHANAVANNLTGGRYFVWNDFPPSDADLALLESLYDDYQWTGVPNFE